MKKTQPPPSQSLDNDFSTWKTSKTLLEKVKNQQDEVAWETFVALYRAFIYSIILKMQITKFDADDITQRVLIKLWQTLPKFQYDPDRGNFRGWLSRITANEVKDHFRRVKRKATVSEEDAEYEIAVKTSEINIPDIDSIIEREWKTYVSKLAWKNVVEHIDKKTAKCFLMFVENEPVEKISKELGIAESSVYVYKKRAQDALKEEIAKLNGLLL